jgi:transcriptional regulator with XRE-family HTH domain
MKKIHKNIGSRIREVRKEKKLTQVEFAELFDITQDKLSKYETGMVCAPIELLLKISEKFKISLNWLLKGKGDKYTPKEQKLDEDIYTIAKKMQTLKEKKPEYFLNLKDSISPWLKE